jgi:hypothetical protein
LFSGKADAARQPRPLFLCTETGQGGGAFAWPESQGRLSRRGSSSTFNFQLFWMMANPIPPVQKNQHFVYLNLL